MAEPTTDPIRERLEEALFEGQPGLELILLAVEAVLDLHVPIEGFNWDNEPTTGCSCWTVGGAHPMFVDCPTRRAIAQALGVEL